MTTLEILLAAVFPSAGLAIIFCALPYWQRDRLFFGVTVAPAFRAETTAMQTVRGYRVGIAAAAIVSLIAAGIGVAIDSPWLFVTGLLVQPLAAAFLFARAHQRALPFAAAPPTTRVASLSATGPRFPGGWMAVLTPFAILSAAAIYIQFHIRQLPARIPVHWAIDGSINGWARSGSIGTFGVLMLGALLSGVILGMGWASLAGTRRGGPDAKSSAWQLRFLSAMLLFSVRMAWILSIMFSFLAVAPLWLGVDREALPVGIATALVLILTGLSVWPLFRLQSEPGSGGDGTPDTCWKWGGIYYNPSDPALLVARRFGIGYTFNWANRAAWLLCTGLLTVILSGLIWLA